MWIAYYFLLRKGFTCGFLTFTFNSESPGSGFMFHCTYNDPSFIKIWKEEIRGHPYIYCMYLRHSCIYPFSAACHGLSHGGREAHTSLTPATSSSSSEGTPRCCQASWKMCSLQWVLSLPWGLFRVRHARNTSSRRRPGGILVRCQNHLNWLLSMWRMSSTLKNNWDKRKVGDWL